MATVIFNYLKNFWLLCEAGRIFVPLPGIEPVPLHWAQGQRIPEFNFYCPTSCLYQMDGKMGELQEEDSKHLGGLEMRQVRFEGSCA